MSYHREISREELFKAQLELLLQNARLPGFGVQVVAIAVSCVLLWTAISPTWLVTWAGTFAVLLAIQAQLMRRALIERNYHRHPARLFWWLVIGSLASGLGWALAFIFAAGSAPEATQHVLLLVIISMTALLVSVTVVVREYFLAFLFGGLWPIGWWCTVHYWEQPNNLVVGLFMLLVCALMVSLSNRIHSYYQNIIALNWERDAMSRELGNLADSLRDRNRQLREVRKQLTRQANVDELTGLANRRRVNQVLQEEINRARRGGTPLAIIMLDVDCFKHFNDSYGHPAGDDVLRRLADILRQVSGRAGELAGRYGGEEFLLVLPGASRSIALRTAVQLRQSLARAAMPHNTSTVASSVTVSQGVAVLEGEFPAEVDTEVLVQQADTALYEAKEAGRNTIKVAPVLSCVAAASACAEEPATSAEEDPL